MLWCKKCSEFVTALDRINSYIFDDKDVFESDEKRQDFIVHDKRAGESEFARAAAIPSQPRQQDVQENRSASVKENRRF